MMRTTRRMLTGVILILVAAGPLASSCDRGREGHVIPITLKRGVTLVTVRVGNTAIPNILLDTGMPFDGVMIYSPSYRDSLDLARAVEVRVGGAGAGQAATALMIDSAAFFLGDIEMTNQRIVVLRGDIYAGFPSNGIIGYSVFGHYATEFNYDDGKMILHDLGGFKAGKGWTAIPMYFKSNDVPWIDASVVIEDEAPVPLSLYIDYASRDAVELLEKPGMKFRLPADTREAHLGTGLSGDIYGKKGRISKLIIGPYELKNVEATIAPAAIRSKQEDADAVLGCGALSRFNLIFDYAGKTLYIAPNKSFNDPFE